MELNKYLRGAALTGVFLIPFIPFVVPGSLFFPFITGKNFAFRILVEIVLALWAILAIREPRYRPQKSLLLWAIVIFTVVMGLANIFGENPARSFWSNFERMEGYVTILHLFGYFIATSALLNTQKLWERLFQVSVGASVLVIVHGIVQLLGKAAIHQGGVRLDASFGNATYLAIYMLVHIMLTLWLFYRHRGVSWVRWVYGIVIIGQAFVLFHTATRGSILGLIGGLFLSALLIALFGKTNPKMRRVSIGAVVGILLLVGGFMLVRNTTFVKNNSTLVRLASISIENNTVQSRFQIWNMAISAAKEHPILGWGQENFLYVFGKYYNPNMYAQEPWFDRAHNVFFDWLVSGGLLGLLSYLSMFLLALVLLWRRNSEFSIVGKSLLTGLLAGYFFHNIFVFDNIVSYILFFTVLAFIHSRSVDVTKQVEEKRTTETNSALSHVFVSIVIVALVSSLYFFNVKGIAQAQALLGALSPQEEGPTKNLELYEKAISYGSYGLGETREQLLRAAAQLGASDAPSDIKQSFVSLAQVEILKQIQLDPKNPRYTFFYGTFLNQFGQHDEAIVWLDRALELSPNKQLILFEKGAAYFNKGEEEDGKAIFKYAYELAPDYDAAVDFYATALIRTGEISDAEELLIEHYGTAAVPSSDQILSAWASVGRNDYVLEIRKQRVANNPEDAQNHVSLARAYLDVGDVGAAISAIEQAIAVDPNFETEGRGIIEGIRSGEIK